MQLFGSFTFFAYWRDGYAALASLDDDGNGWLQGDEPDGLALWTDRNSDGVSDAAEVRSVASAGIVGLATFATEVSPLGPTQARGVCMRDGSVRPSIDLLLSPVDDSSALAR